jgi:soluble lytic murein transglycosylase-like protein
MSEHHPISCPNRWRRIFATVGIMAAALALSSSPAWMDDVPGTAPSSTIEQRMSRFIADYAKHYRLEPALVRAVIKVESGFNPTAVSSKGARGLMQLMPQTAAALEVLDPFDPDENIRAGAGELRRLLNRFNGDLKLALAAYHAGETRVGRYASVLPFRSTERYVGEVLRYYRMFMEREKKGA